MEALKRLGKRIAQLLVYSPLYRLYRLGPSTIGFWHGIDDADVCARITRSETLLWTNNSQCMVVIEKDFNAWCVLAETLAHVYVLTVAYNVLVHRGRRQINPIAASPSL